MPRNHGVLRSISQQRQVGKWQNAAQSLPTSPCEAQCKKNEVKIPKIDFVPTIANQSYSTNIIRRNVVENLDKWRPRLGKEPGCIDMFILTDCERAGCIFGGSGEAMHERGKMHVLSN